MTTTVLNSLARASSAYLRSAMHQPIQWHEWGPEAFAAARQADKPMLLDIGAVWCHWCHVMDRESYDDPAIAAIVNEHFIAVKVDRDERPDIDSRHHAAAQSGAAVPTKSVGGGASDDPLHNLIVITLESMAKGGVYDQLAGGFHRYSVDERWVVPHFEQMCYDNSELLKNYVHAYQTTGNELFASVAREIIRWMDEWLSDRERGGF